LSHASSPFVLLVFFLHFFPWPVLGGNHSTFASQVAGITGMHQHAQPSFIYHALCIGLTVFLSPKGHLGHFQVWAINNKLL
jgi:hypothetical protein